MQDDQAKSKEWQDKLFIFQRYREVREEHALENWRRHSVEWSKVEQSIAKSCGREPGDLLMARLGEYRQKLETTQLLEEAMLLLEAENINFWKEGITIGTDLLGLSLQLPRGGPRQVERLHFNEPSNTRQERASEYRDRKKQELGQLIKKIDPFYKHRGQYLEAVGENLSKFDPKLTEAYVERLEKLQRDQSFHEKEEIEEQESKETIPEIEPLHKGMKLISSTSRLFFEVNLNQISTSIVTIHNRGTVAIHFEWVQVKRPNPLNALLN